jgi:predicted RNA methylase
MAHLHFELIAQVSARAGIDTVFDIGAGSEILGALVPRALGSA